MAERRSTARVHQSGLGDGGMAGERASQEGKRLGGKGHQGQVGTAPPGARQDGERARLLAAARAAALRAYAPYSRFRVGAAVVVETPAGPEVVTGANVENASYGLTLCAERTALAAACQRVPPPEVETGKIQRLRITAVAVACVDATADAPAHERTPCGACRQWLAELAPDAIYYVDGIERDLRLADLLPLAFQLDRNAQAQG